MDKCVFYESWQMECCGDPFRLGETVEWLVYPCKSLRTAIDIGPLDYAYEAHDADWRKLSILKGKVEQIQILYEAYRPSAQNSRLLKPVGGTLVPAESVEGFEESEEGMPASGYLVSLTGCSIRPAEKRDVKYP